RSRGASTTRSAIASRSRCSSEPTWRLRARTSRSWVWGGATCSWAKSRTRAPPSSGLFSSSLPTRPRGKGSGAPAADVDTLFAVAGAGLERFSAEFLTERLRARGTLPHGRVSAVHHGERLPTIVSTVVPLRLEYSADAPADAPSRLFLKTALGGLDASLKSIGEREVTFYRQIAPLMPDGPFARCYDSEFLEGQFHLLLEDLTETHTIVTQ